LHGHCRSQCHRSVFPSRSSFFTRKKNFRGKNFISFRWVIFFTFVFSPSSLFIIVPID
jgi:hypothetical protein